MAAENEKRNEWDKLESKKDIETLMNEQIEIIDNKLKQIVMKIQEVSELLE